MTDHAEDWAEIDLLRTQLSAAQAQIAALEHDIKRHVQIATDQANEIVALKAKRREDVRKCEQTTPDFVLADIILDIRSRKGLGDEWDKIDVDDRNYIAHLWREYIKTAIRAAFPEDFK